MKRAYLVHGWGGNPENCWFPWLKSNLEAQGFEVKSLAMPDSDNPDPLTWPQILLNEVKNPDEQTYLVGHSIGCQTIMRYLEKLPENARVGGLFFVAPFFELIYLKTDSEKNIWGKWKDIPVDTDAVKEHAKRIVSLFSDDDPDVDYKVNGPMLESLLGSKNILLHAKGHFSDDAGVTELPELLAQMNINE